LLVGLAADAAIDDNAADERSARVLWELEGFRHLLHDIGIGVGHGFARADRCRYGGDG
jgi:hypothetical protein